MVDGRNSFADHITYLAYVGSSQEQWLTRAIILVWLYNWVRSKSKEEEVTYRVERPFYSR